MPRTHWHGEGYRTLCGTWQAGDRMTSQTVGPRTCGACLTVYQKAEASIAGMTLTVVDAPTRKVK